MRNIKDFEEFSAPVNEAREVPELQWEKRTVDINDSRLVSWRNAMDFPLTYLKEARRKTGGKTGDPELDKFGASLEKLLDSPQVTKLIDALGEMEQELEALQKKRCGSERVGR